MKQHEIETLARLGALMCTGEAFEDAIRSFSDTDYVREIGKRAWDEIEKYGGIVKPFYDDHYFFTRADWRYEVVNDHTLLGYADWVEHQLEQAGEIDVHVQNSRERHPDKI